MPNSRRGLSMIELLVVMLIIAIALSIYLPSMLVAREAARRSQCGNNLKQLGLATYNYHDLHGVLVPGRIWDRGCGTTPQNICQDTSWTMLILPMMEQHMMYDLYNFDLGAIGSGGEGLVVNRTVNETKINTMLCPSQPGIGFLSPWVARATLPDVAFHMPGEYLSPDFQGLQLSRTNYAANWGNTNWAQTDIPNKPEATFRQAPFGHRGDVRLEDIMDGFSTTILISEVLFGTNADVRGTRNLSLAGTSNYNCGFLPNQFKHVYDLADEKTGDRLAHPSLCFSVPTKMTCIGVDDKNGAFAGAKSGHPKGLQALFADGSVRFIRNTIDPEVWLGLHSINGGEVVSTGRL